MNIRTPYDKNEAIESKEGYVVLTLKNGMEFTLEEQGGGILVRARKGQCTIRPEARNCVTLKDEVSE